MQLQNEEETKQGHSGICCVFFGGVYRGYTLHHFTLLDMSRVADDAVTTGYVVPSVEKKEGMIKRRTKKLVSSFP